VIPFRYQAATDFVDGMSFVYIDGLATYIDKSGSVLWQQKSG
jgi:hypothetical protein